MCEALSEEFCGGGNEMGEYRKDLLGRLNLVLGELGKGLEYLKVRHPDIQPDEFEVIRKRYRDLKRILLGGIASNGARGWTSESINDHPGPLYTMDAR